LIERNADKNFMKLFAPSVTMAVNSHSGIDQSV